MLDLSQHSERLNRFIDKHLPLVTNMGVAIKHYDGNSFVIEAPLALNHNDKMTAFGGSLYCLCITNAIGLVFLKCFEQGLNPDLVVSHAEIDYTLPVKDSAIESSCVSPNNTRWKEFFDTYNENGKSGISLQATIMNGDNVAVSFQGSFAIIGESNTTI